MDPDNPALGERSSRVALNGPTNQIPKVTDNDIVTPHKAWM